MSERCQLIIAIIISLAANFAFAEEPAAQTGTLSEEYLQRWTPGGDTNAADLPYPQVTASYQSENDADWVDDRWQRTQKGPFLSHSILLPGHTVGSKLIAVSAGQKSFHLYDLAAGSFVAGVTSGELRTDPARFGLLNRPKLLGDVTFFVPRDKLWRRGTIHTNVSAEDCDYQGLHLHGDRVLLATRISGTEVLESPLPYDDAHTLTREIEVAAHDAPLWLMIAAECSQLVVGGDGRSATWTDLHGSRRQITLDAAAQVIALESDADTLLLSLPAATQTCSARFTYSGTRDSASNVTSDANRPELPNLAALRQPGPRRWREPLVTKGTLA
ncbi:MAG TPA: DUF6797 domain-containing protein, partial [Lacipirellulaceae bacterium]|nr:DUF6797 domain-containing protein [Lacipirellulaceae bacterium]